MQVQCDAFILKSYLKIHNAIISFYCNIQKWGDAIFIVIRYFLLHLNSVSSKHDRFGPLIFFFWKISSVCISRANPNNNFVLFLILHASSFSVWNDVRKTDPPIQIFIFRHTDIYIRWYQYFQYILR